MKGEIVMKIKIILEPFTVCKVLDYSLVDLNTPFCFIQKTNEENSLVCQTKDVPINTIAREDGWIALKIDGILDFSLIGILSKISTILAEVNISIFALSTFNTDYILIKQEQLDRAIEALKNNGYNLEQGE